MNKVKKAFVSLGLAAMLAITGGSVAQVAVADVSSKAEAYTVTKVEKWQTDRFYSGGRWYCGVWQYRDYNWWEESWMGGSNRDGWYRVYYAWC